MGRQIMMDEELSIHEEEWEVVDSPNDKEESGVVPETIANGCVTKVRTMNDKSSKFTYG
jgi:hypothetical protein